jgi:RNA polymerase sigma-54 factor
MQLQTSQHFGQRQSLVVTAQLQRAICLLQMTNTDLQGFIEKEAEENPFLDMKVREKLTPEARRELAASGPSGGVKAPASDFDFLEMRVAARPPSLYAHVSDQFNVMFPDPRERAMAEVFLEALEPSGWLGDELDLLAQRAGLDPEAADAFLARVQQVEPAGLFARSLAECLELQARDKGWLSAEFAALLANLDKLAAADLKGLSRACSCTPETLRTQMKRLRSLDPKPGAQFDAPTDNQRSPDLIVRKSADGWLVDLNRSTLPTVVIDDASARQMNRTEAREFVSDRLSSARWLRRAIEHRNKTSLQIGAEIARRQTAFLEHGPAHIRPMILRDVAEAVGVHESTVSRVTSGLMMATPQGTFPLKTFFSAALGTSDDDANGSAAAVRHRIQQLVRDEPADAPLSDYAIARIITSEGTELARRTVAKYRDMLKIKSSFQRRREALLNGAA